MRVNLTKKEIINSIYMQIGFPKRIAENLLDDFLNILLDELIKKKKVKIAKFGTFVLRHKKSRVGRNPKTLEKIEVPEKRSIIFKSSKEWKKKLNEKI